MELIHGLNAKESFKDDHGGSEKIVGKTLYYHILSTHTIALRKIKSSMNYIKKMVVNGVK